MQTSTMRLWSWTKYLKKLKSLIEFANLYHKPTYIASKAALPTEQGSAAFGVNLKQQIFSKLCMRAIIIYYNDRYVCITTTV